MKIQHSLLLTAAMLALAPVASDAATVLSYAGSAAVTARADFTGTVGSLFQVNVTGQQITHLGVMDADNPGDAGNNGFADSDGFAVSPITVGLWSWNGTTATLITSATVGSSDPYSDGYRYVDITDVALTSGQQYILGARVGGGIEWFLDAHPSSQFSSASGDFTLLANTHNNGAAFSTAPTVGAGGSLGGVGTLGRWGPANAIVIPETSSALLGGLGLLVLLRRRR